MIPMFGIYMIGFAAMLGIMGKRQLDRNYKVAAGFSLVTAAILMVGGIAVLVQQYFF